MPIPYSVVTLLVVTDNETRTTYPSADVVLGKTHAELVRLRVGK